MLKESVLNSGENRTLISGQELNWLQENGGGGEGIVLFTAGIKDIFSEDGAVFFWLKSEAEQSLVTPRQNLLDQCLVGDKSVNAPPNYVLEGESLFVVSNDFEPNWPAFLARSHSSLVGLHFDDFRGIKHLPSSFCQETVVRAASFQHIDILPLDYRDMGVERELVIKMDEKWRYLKVADDWQERLRSVAPFRFSGWNEVLDVIAEFSQMI